MQGFELEQFSNRQLQKNGIHAISTFLTPITLEPEIKAQMNPMGYGRPYHNPGFPEVKVDFRVKCRVQRDKTLCTHRRVL